MCVTSTSRSTARSGVRLVLISEPTCCWRFSTTTWCPKRVMRRFRRSSSLADSRSSTVRCAKQHGSDWSDHRRSSNCTSRTNGDTIRCCKSPTRSARCSQIGWASPEPSPFGGPLPSKADRTRPAFFGPLALGRFPRLRTAAPVTVGYANGLLEGESDMPVLLNHTIVQAYDKHESAEFLAHILG